MIPYGEPGPLTDMERFAFDSLGYLVIPNALSEDETAAAREACERVHADLPADEWRQLGATFEKEPALEHIVDHPSILPKARALYGDRFILQSSWATVVPPGFAGGGIHEDGSGAYQFSKLATPTPLVQLRTGFVLTDQSEAGAGNMVLLPGSHNTGHPLPPGSKYTDVPHAHLVTGEPGTALMFHQGVHHCGSPNTRDYARHMFHTIYAPPWLNHTDRMTTSPEFLERTTPLRRALMGAWTHDTESFHMSPLPFDD
ncbi:phytanoyl-CoA dioxygenase [Candidatus Poribacteria bacterium]|jgi:ectoine hydroxylase|nr:phytanoyl-CoA dioxygenase [Candidatus Poribacteria bacterium]MBT5534025.1 phytanoyl-CoA dioxygenase [Candidatus Poribacteria bacterium]MBT5709688.1 phytanoyl-CoA dioxygenase [Candidatus Poribacteria bacterium]MBT7101231.1 phytanoyl-CoA dioxygenase [Candidatus Poribacteria bacterium]MBT7804705.1 phytanoyl-CoA dioxygenase [Candidatus Poribacteria bacterium]